MSALHTGGVDIKLGLRSNLVANLTGNTDFADSDVDVQQFNLTPYKLFFPEKRQFFLENAGVFAFPMSLGDSSDQLFFSRQIGIDPVTGQQVSINGGGKVTGTLGGFELGVMDVDTRTSGPNPWANFAVLRVKRSLWNTGSYIGVMGIDKRSGQEGSSFNQTSGVDGRFVLFRNLVLNGYAAQTRTPGLQFSNACNFWPVLDRGIHKIAYAITALQEAHLRIEVRPNLPMLSFYIQPVGAKGRACPQVRLATSSSRASYFTRLTPTPPWEHKNGRPLFAPSTRSGREDFVISNDLGAGLRQ
jgi:hypothetical protein